MIKKILYLLILFCGVTKISSQTNASWQIASKEEVVAAYKKICDWYVNSTSYSFEIKYISYKDHSSSEILESSEGYYKRSGKKYLTNAVGVRTIQNEKTRIIVDSSDKIIAVTDPGTLSPNMQSADDLIKLLENVKSLKKKVNSKGTMYRIDFKKNELFDAYEFLVNEKGLLEKLVYYYSEQIEKEYGDGEEEKPVSSKVQPRLEIQFLNYLYPAKIVDSEFYDKSIVVANNNKITLLDKYRTYQIKDYRQIKK